MRLLPERRDAHRQSLPRQEPARHRRADSTGALECALPPLPQYADAQGHPPLREGSRGMRPRLTSDARRALTRAGLSRAQSRGFSRRSFLKGSGALIVTFASAGALDDVSGVFAQGFNGTGSPQLDSWIAIGADGIVTAYTGKCEFGQGLYTAQMQLVAEELCVPFTRVRLIQCDTSMTPDQGTTSGQQSHPTNFNTTNLALAAATARENLVRLAAARLNAPTQDLVAREGAISVKA